MVLAAVVLGGIYSLSSLSRATAWLKHTDQVRVSVERLRSTLLSAETGVRGYVVSGEPELLEPYSRAVAHWQHQFERLRARTTDNALQQGRLRALDLQVRERMHYLAELRAAYDKGQRGAALAPLMRRGAVSMNAARAIIDDMEEAEIRLDQERQREADQRWQRSMVLFVTGALLFSGVIAMARVRAVRAERDEVVRRQTARAIDRERRLMQAILNGIDDGVTLQDREARLIFANESGARAMGAPTPEALLAEPLAAVFERFELLDEAGHPFPLDKLPPRQILDGKVSEATALLHHRSRATGRERWSNVRSYPVLEGGEIVQAITVFRDVTEERRDLKRREFLLRAADELSSSLDYEATLATVARLAVPVLADWCAVDLVEEGEATRRVATAHVDPAKLVWVRELTKRYPPNPQARAGVAEIIRTGQARLISEIPRELLVAAAVDAEHLRLMDALQLRSFMGVPLVIGGKAIGAISFAMAESQRIYREDDLDFAQSLAQRAALAIQNARLFRELEQARAEMASQFLAEAERRREAEDASRFAEMFVGMLGHDLRNPLNAVVMTARLMQRKGTGEPAALDRIVSSGKRMSNMVGQLLDLTRSRLAGGIPIERREVDLAASFSEVVDELRRAYPAREIVWHSSADAHAAVDRDRLDQVLSNLVGNALEHGDPARPVVVELSGVDEQLRLSVHNEGQPIPAEVLPIIFDPFRRKGASGDRSQGLGLGLFISEQIVLAHGGRIEVTSSAGEGTTFVVSLPGGSGSARMSPEHGAATSTVETLH